MLWRPKLQHIQGISLRAPSLKLRGVISVHEPVLSSSSSYGAFLLRDSPSRLFCCVRSIHPPRGSSILLCWGQLSVTSQSWKCGLGSWNNARTALKQRRISLLNPSCVLGRLNYLQLSAPAEGPLASGSWSSKTPAKVGEPGGHRRSLGLVSYSCKHNDRPDG